MTNSQQFIPVESVIQDYIFLKDGAVGLLLSVSAVNFALLFETEQISIIDSFAGMINSLSFPIQIIIYSKVMDVSSYLHTVDKALAKQTNPLLKKMTLGYRSFVEKSIKDNNVLDKQFYICIKVTPIEIGLLPTNQDEKIRKVTTLLTPKRDHLMRQLNRLGLKAKQLTSEEIIKLFYDIYNPPINISIPEIVTPAQPTTKLVVEENPSPPKLRPIKTTLNQPPVQPVKPTTQIQQTQPIQPTPAVPVSPQIQSSPVRTIQPQMQSSSPFFVEELPDDN